MWNGRSVSPGKGIPFLASGKDLAGSVASTSNFNKVYCGRRPKIFTGRHVSNPWHSAVCQGDRDSIQPRESGEELTAMFHHKNSERECKNPMHSRFVLKPTHTKSSSAT